MPRDDRGTISPFASAQSVSSSRAGSYVGAHTDRQRRFEARSDRRWGNWSILELPFPLLWLYTEPWLSLYDDDDEIEPSTIVELWP
jgi:hypothetical protein